MVGLMVCIRLVKALRMSCACHKRLVVNPAGPLCNPTGWRLLTIVRTSPPMYGLKG